MWAPSKSRGFTIIEVYIIILIVGLLTIFGFPILSSLIKSQTSSTGVISPIITAQKVAPAHDSVATIDIVNNDHTPVSQEPTPTPVVTKTTPLSNEVIEKAKNFYSIHLPILIATYGVQYSPIQANQAAWDAFINLYENTPLDPQTNQPPRFTATTPAVGEVQYKYPAKCASALEFTSSNRGYAFKTKIGTKYACISDIYKYIED